MKAQRNQVTLVTSSNQPAGLSKRLGAAFYDLLLLAAALWFAAIPFVVALDGPPDNFWIRTAFQIYLLIVSFLYYAGF